MDTEYFYAWIELKICFHFKFLILRSLLVSFKPWVWISRVSRYPWTGVSFSTRNSRYPGKDGVSRTGFGELGMDRLRTSRSRVRYFFLFYSIILIQCNACYICTFLFTEGLYTEPEAMLIIGGSKVSKHNNSDEKNLYLKWLKKTISQMIKKTISQMKIFKF